MTRLCVQCTQVDTPTDTTVGTQLQFAISLSVYGISISRPGPIRWCHTVYCTSIMSCHLQQPPPASPGTTRR